MILSLYPEAYQTWNFLENLELSSKLQVFVLLCPQIFIGNCLGKTDFTNSQLVRLRVWRKREASESSEDISSGSKFGGSVKLQKTLRISAQAPSLVQQFEYDYHAWYILHTRVLTIGTALGSLGCQPTLLFNYFTLARLLIIVGRLNR